MLFTVVKILAALWAIELAAFAAWWLWDMLGFRRDQARVLGRLGEFESLEASWRMKAVQPRDRWHA